MKLSSSGTESYYISRDELLRKLGIPVTPQHGERVDITLALASQDGLEVKIARSLPEKELPEAAHPRNEVVARADRWP